MLSIASADFQDDLTNPNAYLGFAGWAGNLELWTEVDDIRLDNGEILPVQVRFSTANATGAKWSNLWWFPLFDGKVTHADDKRISYTTPGGRGRDLLKGKGDEYLSPDGRTKATVSGATIAVQNFPGWRYRFEDKRLVEATTPGGKTLVWSYESDIHAPRQDSARQENGGARLPTAPGGFGETALPDRFFGSDRLKEIREKEGKPVASLSYPGDGIKVTLADRSFLFEQEDPAGPEDSRQWRLHFPDGRQETYRVERKDGVSTLKISSQSGDLGTFTWQSDTGRILSDPAFTYEERALDDGSKLLHRIDRTGQSEWYRYDGKTGQATYKRRDGVRVVTSYVQDRGAMYLKVSQIETVSPEGKTLATRKFAYDGEGVLVRKWTEGGQAAGSGMVDQSEARRLHGVSGVVFVDARSRRTYDAGHIPGAINLTKLRFNEDFRVNEAAIRAAQQIVVYCASRNCEESSIVATMLEQKGFRNILIFEGGWDEW